MKNVPHCYRVPELLIKLQLSERSFYRFLALGELPFLEELSPRLGKLRRYRADLVDAYLENRFDKRALRPRASRKQRVA